jgi:hypothetical protein
MTQDRVDSIEEYDIRRWFMSVDLTQARDTFRVVEGIIETRESMQPKRKRRKDAGTKKSDSVRTSLDLDWARAEGK